MSQLYPECGNLGLVLPKNLSLWTTDKVHKGLLAVVAMTT